MRTLLLLFVLAAEPGFIPLFDGATLRGWKLIGQCGGGYAVEDGTITIVPDELGNLFTEKEYANFILRFEFRLTPGANNGMAIRTPPIWERASREGMEIQILAEDNTRDTKPNHRHGSIYNVAAAKQGCLKPNGEWNQEEIVANGRRITVKVNGTTALDVDLDSIRDPAILKEHPGAGTGAGSHWLYGPLFTRLVPQYPHTGAPMRMLERRDFLLAMVATGPFSGGVDRRGCERRGSRRRLRLQSAAVRASPHGQGRP